MEAMPAPPAPDASGLADGTRRSLPARSVDAERQAGWIVIAVVGIGSLVALVVGLLVDWASAPVDIALGAIWLTVIGLLTWHNVRFVRIHDRHKAWPITVDRGLARTSAQREKRWDQRGGARD